MYLILKIVGIICITSLLICGVKFLFKLMVFYFGEPLHISEKRVKKLIYLDGSTWHYPYVKIRYIWLGLKFYLNLYLYFNISLSKRMLHVHRCYNCVKSKFNSYNKSKNILNDELDYLLKKYKTNKLKEKEDILIE